MTSCRPPLFHKRWFEPTVIVTCVRFYLRFSLSLRDVKELMAERGLAMDHTTIWRWVQAYGREVYRRLQGAVKRKSSTWHMDETFVRIGGRWMYLFRTRSRQRRQPAAASLGARRTTQLSVGHPRTARRRSLASL